MVIFFNPKSMEDALHFNSICARIAYLFKNKNLTTISFLVDGNADDMQYKCQKSQCVDYLLFSL